MIRSKIIITMEGDLPSIAFSDKYKKLIEERIQEELPKELWEYEIWPEFFDDNNYEGVYSLFFYNVKLEEDSEEMEDPRDSKIEHLESRVKSLKTKLKETETELFSYKHKPEKFSLAELNIDYTSLPFCEHCGEGYVDFGVEIMEPDGGTYWCLDCFTSNYELCDQDIAKIEETLQIEKKAHYKKKLEE